MDAVNRQATFYQDDVFHRIDLAKKAMRIIQHHKQEEGACVISIDAPWGMGKSTLFHMWINELEQNNDTCYQYDNDFSINNICVYYNAWENDYHTDALIPLIFSICGSVTIKKKETAIWKESLLEKLRNVVSTAIGTIGYYSCEVATKNSGLATMFGTTTAVATETMFHLIEGNNVEEIGEKYREIEDNRKAFYNAVKELAEEAGKLFVFIDELDRCNPLFAIRTLECIKHFFNIPNVIFIFGLDMNQLIHTVSGVYGYGIDAGGYLSKFFDYQLSIPIPDVKSLMEFAHSKTRIPDFGYNLINEVRSNFHLTPRVLPGIINDSLLLWETERLNKRSIDVSTGIAYVIFLYALKYKYPHNYLNVLEGTCKIQDIMVAQPKGIVKKMIDITEQWIPESTDNLRKQDSDLREMETRHDLHPNETGDYDVQETTIMHMLWGICAAYYSSVQTVGQALSIAI